MGSSVCRRVGDYMLINSNNVNYKITVKDFVKSAVGNPLDFKGIIRVSADFPNPSTLEAGDMYVIITSPVGGTVTDPYSGKTFEDSEKIVWDEVTRSWESLGKINITVNLTTSYSETEVTIHSSAGKETTIQGVTDQLAGVMLPGQYSWLQALSNGSIVPGDPSPLTPLTPAHKHNYNDIINRLVSQQGTGESTIDPMSQKATTDALNLKFDKASVLQVSGAATDKVMSQKAVTDALKTLSDDFNNKLTNYLPLAGGTMKGNIRFPIGNGIACNDVAGTAAYVVLRTWNANNSTRMYVGTVNFPTYISSTASDLIHDRNGSSYEIWDKYNLSNPVRYTLDSSGYPKFKDVNGTDFSYIKAGSSGIIPNYGVPLSSEGSGTCGTSGWAFQYGYFANVYTNRIMFSNNTWTNDLAANRNSNGYLQVLDAYNASSAGGPTNYGTVLQVNSRNAHWANQLWFPGGAEASKNGLYYRHMAYNETTYGEWNKLLTNKDVNIIQTHSSSNPSTLPVNQIFYSEIKGVAGTPTANGSLFSVQGDDEGIQLWANSARTELYYRTKWTSFGNWIKLATTSDLGNYLPLTGGNLTGKLSIKSSSPSLLILDSSSSTESVILFLRSSTSKGAVGYYDDLGAYIYNYNSNKYLFIGNDGYARVGTTSGSTRLALITDIPTVSVCLPLSGGTMSGNISFNGNTGHIVVGARETSNYVSAVSFNKGSATNSALIGYHSTGGSDSSGALILVPYSTSANPWDKTVGLYIAKNELLLDGKTIATTDQIPSIPSISISNSGSGNAVTSITANGHTLNVTKGATYLTSHQTIYDLTFQAGTFSAKTFDPNGAAATVNIPTNTSHITNDSGFITSSALNGYATQAWVNSQNFVKSTSTKKVTDIQVVDALPATQASGVLYLVVK